MDRTGVACTDHVSTLSEVTIVIVRLATMDNTVEVCKACKNIVSV